MAIISAFSLIRAVSLFHITIAFFFLVEPQKIADQNLVYILGEAMKLPHITSFNAPSAATAFIAIMLAFVGVSDLTAVSTSEEISREYWAAVTPVRLLFLFGTCGYTYTTKEGGMFGPQSRSWGAKTNPGDHLKNSFVFTWSFLELATWFWIFVTLRDEKRQVAMRLIEKRKKEAEEWRRMES